MHLEDSSLMCSPSLTTFGSFPMLFTEVERTSKAQPSVSVSLV